MNSCVCVLLLITWIQFPLSSFPVFLFTASYKRPNGEHVNDLLHYSKLLLGYNNNNNSNNIIIIIIC